MLVMISAKLCDIRGLWPSDTLSVYTQLCCYFQIFHRMKKIIVIVLTSYTKAMNSTLALDWDFYDQALEIAEEQKQSLGRPDAVARLTRDFVRVRDLLISQCDETRDTDYFAKTHYVPSCKKGCGEQQVLSCVLATFDECLSKLSSAFAEKEVDSRCKEIRRIDSVFQASVGS